MDQLFAFDFRGPIDSARLESSCKLLVERHSALRTIFAVRDGQIQQIVLKSHDPEFNHYMTIKDSKTLLETLCQAEKHCGIELKDKVVHFLLMNRGISDSTLIMRICHTQFDGTSLPLLYRDLQRSYTRLNLPQAPQFSSFIKDLQSKDTSEGESYWRTLLKDSHATSILHHSTPPYKNTINADVHHIISSLPLT